MSFLHPYNTLRWLEILNDNHSINSIDHRKQLFLNYKNLNYNVLYNVVFLFLQLHRKNLFLWFLKG